MTQKPLTIGVLALQGAYAAHVKALEALGATTRLIRVPLNWKASTASLCPVASPLPCSSSWSAMASSTC